MLTRKPKHPLSLWRDASLKPRDLIPAKDGDIFQVIMPWVADRELEERKSLDSFAPKKTKAKGAKGKA
jgi:hypothetical protein